MDKFNAFFNKYNTPRVFQIFTTLSFITQTILMFVLKVYGLAELGDRYYFNHAEVFFIFDLNFSSFAMSLAKFIVVVAAIAGIVFIWLNRPKIAGLCGGAIMLIMLLSLLRIYDFKNYYDVGSRDPILWTVDVDDTYGFLWGSLALLAVFVVLSTVFTKVGPRVPKVVTVVQPAVQPAQQAQISAADEIRKLKELCDSGAITQEEFDAKKKQLLDLP